MAERISHLSEPRRGGRPPLYPWDEWMDGSAWRITRGEDFEVPASTMVTNVKAHASRRGIPVAVRVIGDTVEFQFDALEQAA